MTLIRSIFLSLTAIFLLSLPAAAQQSAKIKSKERFREKGVKQLSVKNVRSLNGAGAELGISYFQKGLLFFSEPKGAPAGAAPRALFAAFNPGGNPTKPAAYDFRLAGQPTLTGPFAFAKGGKRAFAAVQENQGGRIRHKIVELARENDAWKLVSALDAVNGSGDHNLHPALSPDGTRLFFASDRPGGIGGYDLYVSELKGGQWQAPVNLGPAINTAANDLYPALAASGALFFASAGHTTLGGLDIFTVADPFAETKEAVNLGEPFNSAGNDFNFLLGADGKSGFFVSNRAKGMGKDDIYRFANWKGVE